MSALPDIGQSAGPNNPAAASPAKARVLVVDDSDLIRVLVANMLGTAGYTVVLAGDGRQALTRLQECTVQLVVTDMLMPEMDGLQLIGALKVSHPELAVIAMSGGSVKSDACLERASELGAVCTLAKPFQREQLLEAVDEVLRSQFLRQPPTFNA